MNGHDWPGNVRELENRLKRAVVMADRRLIDGADLELAPPDNAPPNLDLRAARLRAEKDVLQEALARSNNMLSMTARLLGVSRPTLYGLLEVHGLTPENKQGEAPAMPPADSPAGRTETLLNDQG